jgi:hydrogenase maturation protease
MSYWEQLERPAPDTVTVNGVELRRRSRVRLRPRSRADVLDVALDGKTAIVEELVESMEGVVQIAVTVEDDPGRDLGQDRQIGHRFFFSADEVEPLGTRVPPAATQRILIAGIGNVFFGDDGFGVAVAGRLAATTLPPGVEVVDFGIRGMDLAYALRDYDVAILVDAVTRGGAPGTLYVIEPDVEDVDADQAGPDAHAMDPVAVLALARGLGDPLPRVLVVGCEPATVPSDEEDLSAELSEAVRAALDGAVRTVESLLDDLTAEQTNAKEKGLQ